MTDQDLVRAFEGLQVAVMGDLMMDEYVWGDAARVSPESPVLVIEVQRESAVPGGAANVAANIMALGGRATVFGAVGADTKGQDLRRALESLGADTSGIVQDVDRPTTRKTRVVAQNQQVLRVDREATTPLNSVTAEQLGSLLEQAVDSCDAVLVSDYAKGVVEPRTIGPALGRSRQLGLPFLVNGKPSNVPHVRGASVLTLNAAEAATASNDLRFKTDDVDSAGRELREKLGVAALVVTRGSKGLSVWVEDGSSFAVPAHPVEVYDVAGAGDTVAATMALSLAAGSSLEQAARLAVAAAALVVGKVGVATVSTQELIDHDF